MTSSPKRLSTLPPEKDPTEIGEEASTKSHKLKTTSSAAANNQTFFAEEVVIEDLATLHDAADASLVRKWYQNPIILIGLASFFVMLLFFILVSGSQNAQTNELPTVDTSPSNSNVQAEKSVLQQKLDFLDLDIKAADPLEGELSFPPVDFDLELQEANSLDRLRETPQSVNR